MKFCPSSPLRILRQIPVKFGIGVTTIFFFLSDWVRENRSSESHAILMGVKRISVLTFHIFLSDVGVFIQASK
jgi:hypothetical protein